LEALARGDSVEPEIGDLLAHWDDGRIKLLVTASGLRFRRTHPALMMEGTYLPLDAEGARADHVVAFARKNGSGTLLAMVPRLAVPLLGDNRPLPLGVEAWGSTRIALPPAVRAPRYRHLVTGAWCHVDGGEPSSLPVAVALRSCPVALLWAASANE
jgi:(1->4)-alpha-D-glucan 1-alpha-D-glucosylmutase